MADLKNQAFFGICPLKSSFLIPFLILTSLFRHEAGGQGLQVRPGLLFEAAYTGDLVTNLAGGVEQGAVYLDNLDLMFTLETEGLLKWNGGTLFVYGLGNQGGSPSRLVGAAQGVNNIEAPTSWRLYEGWFEQILFDTRLSMLAGVYALDTEFDVIRSASPFLNSSHGTGPDLAQSGQLGPSIFPFTSAGVRVKAVPLDELSVQFALLDGVPSNPDNPRGTHVIFGTDDGLLLAAEVDYHFPQADTTSTRRDSRRRRLSRQQEPLFKARLAAGGWAYTESFNDLEAVDSQGVPLRRRCNRGIYALGEWNVYQNAVDPGQGLTVFARVGFTDDRVNRIGAYTGGGLAYTGLFPGRDRDQTGLGIAAAHNGGTFKRFWRGAGRTAADTEVNIELTYQALIGRWLTFQGDVQYVVNPDTDPSLSNALVTTFRIQINP